MKQGSNMTGNRQGMRKGISLMEMMVAVILLGILSSVGYNYYKNFFDTSLAAKQIKIAVVIEQAAQLKNALELYRTKFGVDVNSTQTLSVLKDQRIITEVPAVIDGVSTTGFVLQANEDVNSTLITTLGGTTEADQIMDYILNVGTVTDKMQYCNALNNIASNGTTDFTVTEDDNTSAGGVIDTDMNASAGTMNNTFFCWNDDGNVSTSNSGITMTFITKIY